MTCQIHKIVSLIQSFIMCYIFNDDIMICGHLRYNSLKYKKLFRAETWTIYWSVNRQKNTDNGWIFLAKISNIYCFQPLKCENVLLFFIIYNNKLNIFEFWTVGQIKQVIYVSHFGLWEIMMDMFHHFRTFYRLKNSMIHH